MNTITVETVVDQPVERVWIFWTEPGHIEEWNHASDDWECSYAENDLQAGGTFSSTMGAIDGSISFDFSGIYSEVVPLQKISYTLGDGRRVTITFEDLSDTSTKVTETFGPETENSHEIQRAGWQAILDNFKAHAEAQSVT